MENREACLVQTAQTESLNTDAGPPAGGVDVVPGGLHAQLRPVDIGLDVAAGS